MGHNNGNGTGLIDSAEHKPDVQSVKSDAAKENTADILFDLWLSGEYRILHRLMEICAKAEENPEYAERINSQNFEAREHAVLHQLGFLKRTQANSHSGECTYKCAGNTTITAVGANMILAKDANEPIDLRFIGPLEDRIKDFREAGSGRNLDISVLANLGGRLANAR